MYAVSIYPDREVRISGKILSQNDVLQFISKNSDIFREDIFLRDDVALGTWYHDAGISYLDVVVVTTSKAKAIKLGRQHQQLAIFGLKNLETISL